MNGFNLSEAREIWFNGAAVHEIHFGTSKLWPVESKPYLRFTAQQDGTFGFGTNPIDYSLDEGMTWTTLSVGSSTPTVSSGSTILWKGTLTPTTSNGIGTFYGTGYFKADGNVMSLLYGDNFVGQTSLSGKTYAFKNLFSNNAYLVNAQNLILPATTLAEHCYDYMFAFCTSLTTAPATLPATTLANNCYQAMFGGCTSLTTAPTLPATTLALWCYTNMFASCTSLTTAPTLPATTLAERCYSGMFQDCTGLTAAPALPATTLATSCYYIMFYHCTSLTSAPVLPATTLVSNCYSAMFQDCTSLNYIKCLATDISAGSCTSNWVNGVASTGTFVKDANMADWAVGADGIPSGWAVLDPFETEYLTIVSLENNNTISWNNNWPAAERTISISTDNGQTWVQKTSDMGGTTLATLNNGNKLLIKGTNSSYAYWEGDDYAYNHFSSTGDFNVEGNIMSVFYGDNFIEQTTLPNEGLLYGLFKGCEGLVSAENLKLPATTLRPYCYDEMFAFCPSLTTAPELPATTLANSCYQSMFYDCTSLNYIKCLATDISATNCTTDWVDGVAATGTFVKSKDMASWATGVNGIPTGWTVENDQVPYDEEYFTIEPLNNGSITFSKTGLSYSTDKITWSSLGTASLSVTQGRNVYLKGTMTPSSSDGIGTLRSTVNINASGNIMSLLYGDNFIGETSLTGKNYAFYALFKNNTYVVNAQNLILPATTLASYCYASMFYGCTGLTTAPELPATTLPSSCYSHMFYNCTSLTTAPVLSATTLAYQCYYGMFNGCTGLTTAPEILPSTTLASYCYYDMFRGCTSLTTAPELPANTLTLGCYYYMFNGCTSLNYIKCLATDTSESNCTGYWVTNVAATGTFVKNPNMASWTTGNSGIPTGWAVIDDGSLISWSQSAYTYYLNSSTYGGPTLANPLSLPVTYASSNPSVATINSSTGEVSVLASGTTAISATFSGDTSYSATTVTYTLTSLKAAAGISWSSNTYQTSLNSPSYPTFSNPNNLAVTFLSTDTSVASIDSSGSITYLTSGVTTLRATFAGSSVYESATTNCVLTLTQYDYGAEYLTFTALANTTFSFKNKGTGNDLEYSLDDGTTWSSLASETSTPTVAAGSSIIWRGTREAHVGSSAQGIGTFSSTGSFDATGNILSIVYGDNYANYTTISREYAFYSLFDSCRQLVHTDNVVLPDNTTEHCYEKMFSGCTAMVTAPTLPSLILTPDCYHDMFRRCSSLTTAPALPATSLQQNCYDGMFRACASLTTSPILPASVIMNYSYQEMFRDCTNLNTVTCLATDITTVQYPMADWLRSVSATGTFYKHHDMSTWPTGTSGIPSGWLVLNYGEAPLYWSKDTYTVEISASSYDWPVLVNPYSLSVTYASSNSSVATVTQQGAVTVHGLGTATISAIFAGSQDYDPVTVSYTLTVTKTNPNLAWSSAAATGQIGVAFSGPTLSNPYSLTVTYSSSDSTVATIDGTGQVTLVDVGSSSISAIFAGNATYEAQTVSYALTVVSGGTVHDWGTDAANEYTPSTTRSYITDVSNLTSSKMNLPATKPDGTTTTIESGFLRSPNSYGNPSQGLTGFKGWIAHYITNSKTTAWDDVSSSDVTILTTWENTPNVKVDYGWMSDMSVSSQSWSDKYVTKKIAAFKNCNLLGIIVMDGSFIEWSQYSNISVKAWNGSETTVDGRPCVSFDPNATVGADGLLITIVYTEA